MRLDGYTYQDISDELGITKQRIEQLLRNNITSDKKEKVTAQKIIFPNVKEWVVRKRHTATSLSELFGVCRPTMSSYLKGKTDIPLTIALEMSAAIGLPIEETFKREGVEENEV